MLKRILSLLLLLTLLTGCTQEPETSGLTIVTTIFPPYDFARAIAGDTAHITMLLSPGAEAHSFEPTPRDIIAIQSCDLFIYAGGENEAWVADMIDALDIDKSKVISMMDVVSPLTEEALPGLESGHEHTHDHEHDASCEHGQDEDTSEYDEHVWTSPKNAALIAQAIADRLCSIDPTNAGLYSTRCANYRQELSALDEKFRSLVENASRRTLVFADRFPARYFTEEYGLEYYAAFPGCSADTEPSAATIAFLIDTVNEQNIPAVFSIELSNGRLASAIAEATGTKVLTFTSCHNLTKEEFDSGATYISLMEGNLSSLQEALY